jgi:hypothetical protein
METQSKIRDFFNDLSLYNFEQLGAMDYEDIVSPKLKSLEETFEGDIEEVKGLSVGNNEVASFIQSVDNNDVEFIIKGIVDESSLNNQTEYINHLISKLMLCKKTIFLLGDYLETRCSYFQTKWKQYIENNGRGLFVEINYFYGLIHGLCQNIGIAIDDYTKLYNKIKSNISIKEEDFKPPYLQDPEFPVSERITRINKEAENFLLLVNRTESVLGFSAVRIALESYVIIKIGDKIRQQVRKERGTNKVDVRLTQLKKKEVFCMLKELLPNEKVHDALNTIYWMYSKRIHRALPQPNYISWGTLWFAMEELEKMMDNLSPEEPKLKTWIKKLVDQKKLVYIS